MTEPDQVLHRDGLVEPVGRLDDGDRLGGRVGRHHRLQRVARRDVDQRETHHANPERDRDRIEDASQDVENHRPTLTGVRSWYQFWACTKPCTFGERARGFTSWTTKIIAASSFIFSCSLVSRSRRFSLSNSLRISTTSLSTSGSLKWPQLAPLGAQSGVQTCRISALNGSCEPRLTLMPLMSICSSTPARVICNNAFQSIMSSVTSNPTASSCALTSSFIGSGCICPEPDVEIANFTLHGTQPASLSKAFALSGSYLYSIG